MQASDAPEFLPPPEPGIVRSVGIAVLAHVALALALSWGLRWQQDDRQVAVEAELWSAAAQQAAPRAVEPPPPPPAPAPVQRPDPTPAPPPPPPPQVRDADIAIEREKQRQAQEKARQEAQRQQELKRRQQEEAEKAERKAAEARRKQEEQAKAAADAKRRQQQEEQRLAQLREENLKRMQGLAGATGGTASTGTAQRSSGPSDSYGGRVRARVKPNIVFNDEISGNPSAEVRVRLAPDGTIVGQQLLKSSGVKSWDDAVLRALDRTQVLPRDIDGRVPPTLDLVFRPKD